MSLKPPKKSDLDKSWIKPRRDSHKKIQPEYHLIITEGTDTEPAYFGVMKEIINSAYSDRIQLSVLGAGDNTLSLFQKAKNMAASSANGYKHVWVVYDTDDFPADHINKTSALCTSESTDETIYHAIWSNQCLNCGFCFISATCNLIFTGHPTGQSSQKFLPLLVTVNIKRIVLICIRFSCHTWMQLLQMQKSLIESTKENFHQLLPLEPKYMNL